MASPNEGKSTPIDITSNNDIISLNCIYGSQLEPTSVEATANTGVFFSLVRVDFTHMLQNYCIGLPTTEKQLWHVVGGK